MKHFSLHFFIALLCLAFILPSCNTARQLEKGKLRKKSSAFLVKKLQQNQTEADWFSGKAKVAYSGDGQSIRAIANIRMRRDSVVWMNVKKLGIEAVRVQITPDSVYFLNRLTRQFAVYDLSFLERQFNLPLDFADLQELILGNAVMVDKENLESGVSGITHQLNGQQAGVNTEYSLDGLTYFLQQIVVSAPDNKWEVQIDQTEYGLEKQYVNFPYFRNFAINSQQTGPMGLDVKFSKIDVNVPKNIQFEIPSRYSRME